MQALVDGNAANEVLPLMLFMVIVSTRGFPVFPKDSLSELAHASVLQLD